MLPGGWYSHADKLKLTLRTATSQARLKVIAQLLQIPDGQLFFEELQLVIPEAMQLALLPLIRVLCEGRVRRLQLQVWPCEHPSVSGPLLHKGPICIVSDCCMVAACCLMVLPCLCCAGRRAGWGKCSKSSGGTQQVGAAYNKGQQAQ